jgi:hypothetical protein
MWSFIPQEWTVIFTARTGAWYENRGSQNFSSRKDDELEVSWQIEIAIKEATRSDRTYGAARADKAKWASIIASAAIPILTAVKN